MKINVVGLGYIGLPTSLILAANGNDVLGTDVNEKLVATLNEGKVTFEEEGLQALYSDAIKNDIEFSTDLIKADMYIVTVPTPYNGETKQIDPIYIINATKSIMDITSDAILVIESTVSPGTIDKYIRPIVDSTDNNIEIVHAPERILPGFMINELKNNSRTIGADKPEVAEIVKKVYETFCNSEIAITDIKTAELSKVVENTFRDINIAFANELTQICREAGVDVYEVIRIANKHPRVNILSPGPGVGGHCISVDPWFLVGDYPDLTKLILTARNVNDNMPVHVYDRLIEIMQNNNITDFSKVGLYGITYKENVDDIRESPTLQLIEKGLPGMEKVHLYDPFVQTTIVNNQNSSFEEFVEKSEIIVIMVAHNHIVANQDAVENLIVFDTKNVLTNLSTEKL